MNIKIEPSSLSGTVKIPSSKSISHRMLISAALADGVSEITGVSSSKDIEATINCLKALGADISDNNGKITVRGIKTPSEKATLDCCESGSTLRFLIPIASALGTEATFLGKGKLPERPITPYLREMPKYGVSFDYNNTMPFTVSGKLGGGEYLLEGDISSQFITGLLFALPLCREDSRIKMLSPLESKPYADMTIDCMRKAGIEITETPDGYIIPGNTGYKPFTSSVEGDYSQGAFFFVANAIGSDIAVENLLAESVQGDKKILEIIEDMCYNDKSGKLSHFEVSVEDIPDLVPILAVLGSFGDKPSVIKGAKRLKIKESDRLIAISDALNRIGGKVTALEDGLIIEPVKEFTGGTADSFNDHRIVMSLAIASTRSKAPVIITNAEAVTKSYPDFFTEFNKLGGKSYVINME